jgi:hypothetical protein
VSLTEFYLYFPPQFSSKAKGDALGGSISHMLSRSLFFFVILLFQITSIAAKEEVEMVQFISVVELDLSRFFLVIC